MKFADSICNMSTCRPNTPTPKFKRALKMLLKACRINGVKYNGTGLMARFKVSCATGFRARGSCCFSMAFGVQG